MRTAIIGTRPGPTPTHGPSARSPATECAKAAAPAPRRPSPASLEEVAALAETHREPTLGAWLKTEVRPVRIAAGTLEIDCGPAPNRKMLALLQSRLEAWTGARWMIALTDAGGGATLAERAQAAADAADEAAKGHPLVRAIIEAFPGARVRAVHRASGSGAVEGDPSP